jgi:hypothetical protein
LQNYFGFQHCLRSSSSVRVVLVSRSSCDPTEWFQPDPKSPIGPRLSQLVFPTATWGHPSDLECLHLLLSPLPVDHPTSTWATSPDVTFRVPIGRPQGSASLPTSAGSRFRFSRFLRSVIRLFDLQFLLSTCRNPPSPSRQDVSCFPPSICHFPPSAFRLPTLSFPPSPLPARAPASDALCQ